MRDFTNHLALAGLLLGMAQPTLFGQAPRMGASPQILAQQVSAITTYWSPQRRAEAIPREKIVDPLSVSAPTVAPTAVEPEVSKPGAPPRLGGGVAGATTVDAPELEYWSEERRAAAVPREFGVDAGGTEAPAATVEPTGYTYAYPFSQFAVSQLLYRTNRVYPYITVGKLFFTLGGLDYVCTASVVRPHILLTARHCIFDYLHPSGGRFATNVVFYPAYNGTGNAALGGAWYARRLITWVANAPNLNYDIGFVQLFDDNEAGCGGSAGGQPIETYTGYLGYQYGGSYNKRHWNQFGYPSAPPFSGDRMIESQSSTGAQDQFGFTDTVEVGNSQTGGASGGPWILTFKQGQTGANNYANGINSFKFFVPDRSRALNSPKFFNYNFNQLLVGAMSFFACP